MNPFLDADDGPIANPFAPAAEGRTRRPADGAAQAATARPRARGRRELREGPRRRRSDAAYCQFGPLTAYPRAQRIRDLYPRLPAAPLPAVITCISTIVAARGEGHGLRLVEAVCDDLAARGFAAVEAYPELRTTPEATSGATPAFWEAAGFVRAIDDPRFPVMRRELA